MMKSITAMTSIPSLFGKMVRDSHDWDISRFLALQGPKVLCFLNAHAITTSQKDAEFADSLMHSTALLRDGIGVKLGLIIHGYPSTPNLNGTDLITKLLGELEEKKIALYGSSDATLRKCRARLREERICDLAFVEHGFSEQSFYLSCAHESQPDVILLCMGMPRQEVLARKLILSGFNGLVICGGGWADFFSKLKPRAPLWMRRFGLEWIYRLTREPRRLGRRYTIDVLQFFGLVFLSRISKRTK